MKRKLFLATVLLGASLVSSSPASSSATSTVRFCDTACPTADGLCNCPIWTDRPKALTLCSSWRSGTGCWYV